jgi:hypothetical protein
MGDGEIVCVDLGMVVVICGLHLLVGFWTSAALQVHGMGAKNRLGLGRMRGMREVGFFRVLCGVGECWVLDGSIKYFYWSLGVCLFISSSFV